MWAFGANNRKAKLDEERQVQEQLIKEQLKTLELEKELRELEKEKITQKGFVQVARRKIRQEGENEKNQSSSSEQDDQQKDKKSLSHIEMARQGYQQLVDAIIRPPRAKYKMEDLGPPRFMFCGKQFTRTDVTLMTERGYNIECSHWEPVQRHTECTPVLIYMHGNASARVEVLPQLSYLLSLGIAVFAFDFAGSGKSDGEYVSLGYYEREDLTCVVAHLRAAPGISTIAFWGRSMGAAAALMYGDRDPDIACMIIDSSFADLVQLAEEMVEKAREQGIVLPNVVVSAALRMIQWSVEKHANFNIKQVSPISHAGNCVIPALFVTGEHDDFIKKHHSEAICENYAGHKNLMVVAGDHNDPRPKIMFDAASSFLQQYLQIPESWALPVPPLMNLLCPPWYHSQSPLQVSQPQNTPVVNDDNAASTKPSSKENTGFDSDEMGMTQERQQEIQASLFKMMGHE